VNGINFLTGLAYAERAPEPRNDPALFEPVKCRVLKPFNIAGQRQEVGSVIVLARHDAKSLEAIKKVEIL
jgi:hypothetical protein